jgi:hypothetical protein
MYEKEQIIQSCYEHGCSYLVDCTKFTNNIDYIINTKKYNLGNSFLIGQIADRIIKPMSRFGLAGEQRKVDKQKIVDWLEKIING